MSHVLVVIATGLAAAACSGDDDGPAASTASTAPNAAAVETVASTEPSTVAPPPATAAPSTPPSTAPATTPESTAPDTTAPPQPGVDVVDLVGRLSSDEFAGRDDGSDGWLLAQQFLVEQLEAIAEPAFPSGFVQPGQSANVVALIPGGELADEYVVIGAHYDGLGAGAPDCRVLDPSDTICNGAADNATGVAVVLAVAHHIVESGTPRRSVLIGLWDREEDGLLGSQDFLWAPPVPAEQMVAYMNFDIQGANLLPSLRETTIMVGAETGGPNLVAAAQRATEASSLSTTALSLVFGQGRSDHANFVNFRVPSVFFTDANNGCYHTSRDDIAAVDFTKLDQQIVTAKALADELLSTDQLPELATDLPVATYSDAVAMLDIVERAEVDFGLVTAVDRGTLDQYIVDLRAIVEAGEAEFDEADINPLLSGAATMVGALATTECDGYVAEGG